MIEEKGKYWYLYEHDICPVCGDADTYKERVYDSPKPTKHEDRHIITSSYCGCMNHEFY